MVGRRQFLASLVAALSELRVLARHGSWAQLAGMQLLRTGNLLLLSIVLPLQGLLGVNQMICVAHCSQGLALGTICHLLLLLNLLVLLVSLVVPLRLVDESALFDNSMLLMTAAQSAAVWLRQNTSITLLVVVTLTSAA